MDLVIDAQIVKGYYLESVRKVDSDLTGEASGIFHRIGGEDKVFLDEGGHIEKEWENVVDPIWFSGWYPQMLIEGGAELINTSTCQTTLRALRQRGFPTKGSKDRWYIRTAKAVSHRLGKSFIVTEDMHFYEPSKCSLSGASRRKVLLRGKGSVSRHLSNNENISVCCVATYLALISCAANEST